MISYAAQKCVYDTVFDLSIYFDSNKSGIMYYSAFIAMHWTINSSLLGKMGNAMYQSMVCPGKEH